MLKSKNFRQVLVAIVIFSMITFVGYSPNVKAASLESAKDTISDSDFSASSSHTILIDLGDSNPLVSTDYININFAAEFTTVSHNNAVCPANTTAAAGSTGQDVRCNVGAFLDATSSTYTIVVYGVTNPTTGDGIGDYDVTVSTHDSGDVEKESTTMKVYIMDDVTVQATVPSTLTFTLGTTSAAYSINGVNTTAETTATSTLNFGTLAAGTQAVLGQELAVSTNADGGFAVTVFPDGSFDNAAGADIDNYASTTPAAWVDPTAGVDINDENTYGYWGLTSSDSDLFNASEFKGFYNTDPLTVFSHSGPADGQTAGIGVADVGYSVEITDVQEAGDYDVVLTYICTPTY